MVEFYLTQVILPGIALLFLGGAGALYAQEWLKRQARLRAFLRNTKERQRRREIYNIAHEMADVAIRRFEKKELKKAMDDAAYEGCQRAMAWVTHCEDTKAKKQQATELGRMLDLEAKIRKIACNEARKATLFLTGQLAPEAFKPVETSNPDKEPEPLSLSSILEEAAKAVNDFFGKAPRSKPDKKEAAE